MLKRYDFLDGIRSLAIFLVFNVHFFGLFDKESYFSKGLTRDVISILHSGHIGVDLFFVLSGYLIYASLAKQPSFNFKFYLRFLMARFKRLFPGHVAVLILLYMLTPVSAGSFISNAFFLNTGMNYVTWSLMYEWVFYILWGFLFFLVSTKNIKEHIAIFILAILFTLLIFLIPDEYIVRSVGFIFGILIYKNQIKLKAITSSFAKYFILGTATILILCCLYFWAHIQMNTLQRNVLFLVVNIGWSLFFISVLITEKVKQAFSFKPLVKLGVSSYSFYLVHATVIELVVKHIYRVNSFAELIIAYALCFGLCYSVAFIIYRFVEFSMIKKALFKS